MRNQFYFHGIPAALRRQISRQHVQNAGAPDDPLATARVLWDFPARECQLVAVDLVNRAAAKLEPNTLAFCVSELVQQKSWWDTVDLLASTALGQAFRSPSVQNAHLKAFRQSSDFWMRRCALLFQLKYGAQLNQKLLFEIVDENLGSREFFINKAIGWSLRQHAKIDREAVEHFVSERELAPLSKREALR